MYSPRHILITGASSGIGAALAEAYAGPDVRLSLHGRKSDRLEAVAGLARGKGATVSLKIGDVVYAEALTSWIKECDAQQPIDLVIANAGVSAGTGHGIESDAQVRAIFAINIDGVLNTIQPAIELMKERGRGQIAVMSSLASFRGFPSAPAYCASKAAIRTYGEGLRGILAQHNINVNVICPGFVKTPMTDENHFPMPLMMPAARAARIIIKGLAQNRARIAFPTRLYLTLRLLNAFPLRLSDYFVRSLPQKAGS